MKKRWVFLIALMLCVAFAASAAAEITLEKIREMPEAHFVAGTDMLYVADGNNYAIASLNGDLLTPALYRGLYYPYDGGYGYFVVRENRDGKNVNGLMDLDCNLIIPCQYGSIIMVSEYWAVAMHRLEDDTLAKDGSYGLYDVFDVYRLTDGQKMASLTYDEYERSLEAGSRINIKNRTTGQTSCYDLDFNCVGSDLEDEYDFRYSDAEATPYISDEGYLIEYGVKNGKTGEILMQPGEYFYITPFVDGYACVQGMQNGLIDETGTFVLEPVYDRILPSSKGPASLTKGNVEYVYKTAGYFCVEIDGKTCYLSESGELTKTDYQIFDLDNDGLSFMVTDDNGATVIVPAQGEPHTVSGYDSVDSMYYSAGLLYRAELGKGRGLIDWQGNVLAEPVYSNVELSGDGCFLLLTKDHISTLYRIHYGDLQMAPTLLIGGAAVTGSGAQTAAAPAAEPAAPSAPAAPIAQDVSVEIPPVADAHAFFEYVMQGEGLRFVSGSHLLLQGNEAEGGVLRMPEDPSYVSDFRLAMVDTPCGYGYYSIAIAEQGVNTLLLFDAESDPIIPRTYGKYAFAGPDWVLAYSYTEGSAENYDEELTLFGTYYGIVDYIDVYHLPSGQKVGTIAKEDCQIAYPIGSMIGIRNEANVTTVYDTQFNVTGVGTAEDFYIGYLSSDIAQALSGYDRVGMMGDWYRVEKDGKVGLVNYKGELILEPVYDDVLESETSAANDENSQPAWLDYCMGGHYVVEKDGWIHFLRAYDGKFAPASFDASNRYAVLGACLYVEVEEGVYALLAPDGHIFVFEKGLKFGTLAATEGRLLLMSYDGEKIGLMDWDGTVVVPPEYDNITTSTDGEYVMLEKDGMCYVYRICYTDPAMTASAYATKAAAAPAAATAAPTVVSTTAATAVPTAEPAPVMSAAKRGIAVRALLDEAVKRLGEDAEGQKANVIELINGAITLLGEENPSAATLLNTTLPLVEGGNAEAVKTILESVKMIL